MVALANEFRPGVMVAGDYPYRDNLVAGSINKNESALHAAVREMREETGLDLGSPTLIHPGAYVSSAKVFIDRVRNGDITDLKTLVAGYWFAERQAAR
jgi:8-oxo-dGTP pyrophosphatase MutT (NUDIX family)